MYTYKDRIKAVRLYLKLGKRLGVTIRQLGYPTKNTLIGWYREYLAKQDLRVGYSRSRGRYTDAQKHKAVEHYLDQGRCMAFTLRELGYPSREILTNLIDELYPEHVPGWLVEPPTSSIPQRSKRQRSSNFVPGPPAPRRSPRR